MPRPAWFIDLDQVHSSYLLLATLALAGILIGILFQIGLLGWVLRVVGLGIRHGIRRGFLVWRRLLSWAPWHIFLVVVLGFLILGWAVSGLMPFLTVVCGLTPLLMGVTTCLAYMFIDLERYEVERGYKAVHNPLKGQELAIHLAQYGEQVRFPLLVAATAGMIAGFALFNQGLYETIGRNWYTVGDQNAEPGYLDFLAYGIIHLLGIVDVLNLASSSSFLRMAYVHQKAWPASTLLTGFKAFFTFVLLQQIFASLRQGRLLAETITDFWSPHEPIHDRARNALPQYGALAIGPLLMSLREVQTLTKEQRDQVPQILATIGPATIPGLIRHLHDPHEHIRAIVVATLGRLHAVDTVVLLVQLDDDPSEVVRQSLAEALGFVGGPGTRPIRSRRVRRHRLKKLIAKLRWPRQKKQRPPEPEPVGDPMVLAVGSLQKALKDTTSVVRNQAAISLGLIGLPASTAATDLIVSLHDADETVRCHAAESLGKVKGEETSTVAALIELLQDASAGVKASAARALGTLKKAAAPAVASLVPLLQDREESVRTAAAEAISQVGPLSEGATDSLVEGLASPDNLVRAQAAEALGTIGTTAQDAAPALVEAVKNGNARVQAKAVEALGKIGEAAAEVAVPSLVRALRGRDSWVSALAAEALGQMGESADEAVPALVRSLGHVNSLVRSNAAEALTKMGPSAAAARPVLEKVAGDEDGSVRSHAIRALGAIGNPTAKTKRVALDGLQDADPLVRAAAVEAIGEWGETSVEWVGSLMPLLEDANDQVKIQTAMVLPKMTGPTPEVIEGLCRRLLVDDSAWVKEHAASALGHLGHEAVAAGGPLLRAAQTGEVAVRLEAMRAIAMIQPLESLAAFASGMKDAESTIRKVASAGWMIAPAIPEEVIPDLVEALRDPEVQVRANVAHALARLTELPAEAIPLLIACTADPSDGLRMNAAMALKIAPPGKAEKVMQQLIEDPNVRIRLIAASCILPVDPENAKAAAVLAEALNEDAPRVRKAAEQLAESLKQTAEETLKAKTG